jgi:hypothetical protein
MEKFTQSSLVDLRDFAIRFLHPPSSPGFRPRDVLADL